MDMRSIHHEYSPRLNHTMYLSLLAPTKNSLWKMRNAQPSTVHALDMGYDRQTVDWLNQFSGRGTTRAENVQGKTAQSHILPDILVYENKLRGLGLRD